MEYVKANVSFRFFRLGFDSLREYHHPQRTSPADFLYDSQDSPPEKLSRLPPQGSSLDNF